MLRRLPYRIQVPFGLSVAVLVTALLVTGVSARISTTNARALTLATLERAVVLLVAQAKPLLAGEDTWRMFAFLRDTAALVPGTLAGHARLAVLDIEISAPITYSIRFDLLVNKPAPGAARFHHMLVLIQCGLSNLLTF